MIIAFNATVATVCYIFRKAIIDPRGLVSPLLYPDKILEISVLLLFIFGIMQIPLLLCIRGIKTIDMLED